MSLALNKGVAFGQISAKKLDMIAGAVLGMVVGAAAFAGVDTTFGTIALPLSPVGMIFAWITGSLGVLATLAAFVIAAIAAIAGKLTAFLTSFGVALSLVALPSVLAKMFTAVLPLLA